VPEIDVTLPLLGQVSTVCDSESAVVGHEIIQLIYNIKISKLVRLLISNAPYKSDDRTGNGKGEIRGAIINWDNEGNRDGHENRAWLGGLMVPEI
jgi:hypothetical protein